MRIFGFLLIFLTKINTNSAKICLLFRRKGIAGRGKVFSAQEKPGTEIDGESAGLYARTGDE